MTKRDRAKESAENATRDSEARRESGEPGGGAGRRDDVGRGGGVYPFSATERPQGLEIRTQHEWGQPGLDPDAPEPSGGSELVWRDGQLLGGLTAGANGEPTIDIHHGVREHDTRHEIGNPAGKHRDPDAKK